MSLLTGGDAVASTIQGGFLGEEGMRRRTLLEYYHDDGGGLNASNTVGTNTTVCECWNQTNATSLPDDYYDVAEPIPQIDQTSPGFPGNNLFLSLWLGLYSSAQICLKWKAARAMVQMSDAMRRDEEHDGGQVTVTSAKSASHRRHGSEDDVD